MKGVRHQRPGGTHGSEHLETGPSSTSLATEPLSNHPSHLHPEGAAGNECPQKCISQCGHHVPLGRLLDPSEPICLSCESPRGSARPLAQGWHVVGTHRVQGLGLEAKSWRSWCWLWGLLG